MNELKLYHYWRSSSSWRVRWALAHKNVDCEMISVHLLKAEQNSSEHLKRNPSGLVPSLEIRSDGQTFHLGESMAMAEWIEETYPTPSLYPTDTLERARCRELCQIVAAGIQPLQNLAVQKYVSEDTEVRKSWATHWIKKGLHTYEARIKETAKNWSLGETLTMADIFLIPQCYNALRNGIDLDEFPLIHRIHEHAKNDSGYQKSEPNAFEPK